MVPARRHKTHAVDWLVRRGPRARDAPTGAAGRHSSVSAGLADAVRQDRVRCSQPPTLETAEPSIPNVRRMGPQYIASWEGHHTTELYGKYPLQMVSPASALSAFTPWATARTAWRQRGQKSPHTPRRRPLLLDHSRSTPRTQRRGISAKATWCGPSTTGAGDPLRRRCTERVPPARVHSYESCADYLPHRRTRPFRRHRRLREHPHQQAHDHPDIPGDGEQLMPDPGREVGGRGPMKSWHLIVDVARCHDCNDCFLA